MLEHHRVAVNIAGSFQVEGTLLNPPKVQAWSCTACGTDWAVSVVNTHLYLDRLVVAVELAAARSLLAKVVAALAGEAPGLTDAQLRARLVALAGYVR